MVFLTCRPPKKESRASWFLQLLLLRVLKQSSCIPMTEIRKAQKLSMLLVILWILKISLFPLSSTVALQGDMENLLSVYIREIIQEILKIIMYSALIINMQHMFYMYCIYMLQVIMHLSSLPILWPKYFTWLITKYILSLLLET